MHMRRGKTVGDTARKRLPARRGERPREKPNLPTPRSCTSSLQNCDQVSVSFKSPSLWHFAMVALASQYTCDSSRLSFRGHRSPICRRDGFPPLWPHRVDLGGSLGSRTQSTRRYAARGSHVQGRGWRESGLRHSRSICLQLETSN